MTHKLHIFINWCHEHDMKKWKMQSLLKEWNKTCYEIMKNTKLIKKMKQHDMS